MFIEVRTGDLMNTHQRLYCLNQVVRYDCISLNVRCNATDIWGNTFHPYCNPTIEILHFVDRAFLVNDQHDTQILFYAFISICNSVHVSSTSCLSSGETNCINTASGNSLLPSCTHLDHQHRMTVTRGCIDKICLSWWWTLCARNM